MTSETKDTKDKEQSPSASQETPKKKTIWNGFVKFLSMGGIIVILIAAVAIYVVISEFLCK